MVIKNTTTYTDKTLEKAAIASNYNNETYKKKKLLFMEIMMLMELLV